MSFRFRGETRDLNGTTCRDLSGSFVELPGGVTHYELGNPEKDNTVVLVHGFSVPYFIYDPTFNFLAESGFRVLRYDLFGRGFSDRPHRPHNIDLFVRQLEELLDALRVRRPVSLVGLSMGGPITAAFTARYPARVQKLVLIDPSGARPLDAALMLKTARLPFVGELIFGQAGSAGMLRSIASDFFDPSMLEHFRSWYRIQMEYKGFMRSILSTIRHGMLGSFLEYYQQVGKMETPVLLFWGRADRTVPFEHSKDLRTAMPNLELHPIENCGHIPHYEKPDEVNPVLLEFLRRSCTRGCSPISRPTNTC